MGNQAAINRAIEYFLKDSLSVHHPQCVAHLHCPSLVISQAAEVLINATNQSMDSWDQSPSATIIEMKLIEWLRARVGFPAGDAGVFTSGGTQSNLMGLMLARDAFFAVRALHPTGWAAGDIRKYKVLCSENAHFSVQKNMALMGLGYRSVTLVKTDEFARMDVSDLQAKIAQAQANGEQIMAIVATAGTTDAGAIDPLRDIAGIAAEHQIWLHVDAAWGGALLSEQYRDYLDGLELVDSVTLDFHKQFFQTISCGAFLLKDARHYELMRYQAAYLNSEFDEEHGVPNLVSVAADHPSLRCAEAVDGSGSAGPETVCGDHRSRRHDGENVAEYVKSQPTLELVMQPQLASVLFRSRPAQMAGSDAAAIALLNQRVGDALLASGRANVGVTEHNGVTCLKLTLLNPVVMLDDVKVLLNLVERTAQELLAQ
ncbi:pyridoxal-dependent decarboxylase [Klebsiella pneumoniae subsp. pneumoniae]|nr:pyridoxal-dependent decarboxylase [Klebsiella pneumoniae subsp. pneumoniae]